MPTVPLYDPTAEPFAWHRVRAPGGWERWTFAAQANDPSIRLDISFFTGYPTQSYRTAYQRFLSAPTRNAPPVPLDSICVTVRASVDNRTVAERLPVNATQFRETTQPYCIQMGDHQIRMDDRGTMELEAGKLCRVELTLVANGDQLTADGSVRHDGRTVEFHGQAQKSYAFGLSLLNDENAV